MYNDDFEEEADNVEQEQTQEVAQPTPPVEQVDQTKAFATRLKEEKAKAKEEAKEEIAQSFGYNSWKEYIDAQTNNKLMDNGLDPETIKPVIKDLIKNDPEYLEAMKYKEEKEELEKEIFASNSIKALNEKFGTHFKSINDLDENTIKDWNAGLSLEKAYTANNFESIMNNAIKNANKLQDNGKSHLKTVTGSNETVTVREPSKNEIAVAKMFGYSEEQFREYLKKKGE